MHVWVRVCVLCVAGWGVCSYVNVWGMCCVMCVCDWVHNVRLCVTCGWEKGVSECV